MFLFVHHISALLVLFRNAVCDVSSKTAMRDDWPNRQTFSANLSRLDIQWSSAGLRRGSASSRSYYKCFSMLTIKSQLKRIQLLDGAARDPEDMEEIMRGIEAPATRRERVLLSELKLQMETPSSVDPVDALTTLSVGVKSANDSVLAVSSQAIEPWDFE